MTDSWRVNRVAEGKYVGAVFLDLSKAFDSFKSGSATQINFYSKGVAELRHQRMASEFTKGETTHDCYYCNHVVTDSTCGFKLLELISKIQNSKKIRGGGPPPRPSPPFLWPPTVSV